MTVAENLARWREAERGASEGPWRVGAEGSEGSRVNPDTGDKRTDGRYLVACNGRVQPEDGRNATFIATARTALPALLGFAEAVLALHVPLNDLGSPPCKTCVSDIDGEAGMTPWPCPIYRLAAQYLCGTS